MVIGHTVWLHTLLDLVRLVFAGQSLRKGGNNTDMMTSRMEVTALMLALSQASVSYKSTVTLFFATQTGSNAS